MTRFTELILSAVALVVLSPLFLVLAVVVKTTSTGPVFHKALRVGRSGKTFWLYKFRTMWAGAAGSGPVLTVAGDRRVTPAGRFLRYFKLDEIPQLFNVLNGTMSLVGPRPEDPRFVKYYSAKQRRLLTVRPGITGAASLIFKNENQYLHGRDFEKTYLESILPEKLRLELQYLDRRSAYTDLVLILQTLVAVGFRQDSLNGAVSLRAREAADPRHAEKGRT